MKILMVFSTALLFFACGSVSLAQNPLPPENQSIVDQSKAGAFVIDGPRNVAY